MRLPEETIRRITRERDEARATLARLDEEPTMTVAEHVAEDRTLGILLPNAFRIVAKRIVEESK